MKKSIYFDDASSVADVCAFLARNGIAVISEV